MFFCGVEFDGFGRDGCWVLLLWSVEGVLFGFGDVVVYLL